MHKDANFLIWLWAKGKRELAAKCMKALPPNDQECFARYVFYAEMQSCVGCGKTGKIKSAVLRDGTTIHAAKSVGQS